MNGRCILMCSGEFHPMNIDRKPQDFVIAVDGGLRYLMECGIEPDFLMGDFDSLGEDFADIVAKYRGMGEEPGGQGRHGHDGSGKARNTKRL